MQKLLVIFFVFFFGASLAQFHDIRPWFCHDHDCPGFTNYTTNTKYEVREYHPYHWVATSVQSYDLHKAIHHGFLKLYNYIAGDNQLNTRIEMGVPVKVEVFPSPTTFGPCNVTISFFLPYEYQTAPAPKPNDPDVRLVQSFKQKYAVLSFGGYAFEAEILERLATLSGHLDNSKVNYHSSYFIYAGYDAPWRFFHRHNEVWLALKEK